ncbi:MAG TPA: hypothetical protein VLV81_10110 [Acidimicrobiia bacterium]|nr:hypothetical protein [Acidimicrobiia bacterium]
MSAALAPVAAAQSTATTRWTRFRHVPAVVDLTGPRGDGSLTVAADGRLLRLPPGSGPVAFADRYRTAKGPEPYIALSTGETPDGAGCSFSPDRVYALEPTAHPGVIEIDAQGQTRRLVDLPAGLALDGIAFDEVGRFGHRLLVTASSSGGITVDAIDCAGRVATITAHAPSMEGGIVVAPATFGAFAGDLVGADEHSGRLVAVAPDGATAVVARSGLPSGGDVGIESIGVIPADVQSESAYLADRRSPGNPHPGTDSILRLTGTQLARAGARPGDLLVATEGAARTILVHCASTCTVRHIADGLAVSHAEGHIVFGPTSPRVKLERSERQPTGAGDETAPRSSAG